MESSVRRKSHSALYLLFAEGFCLLLIAAAVIACGFVLNYHDDFDYDQLSVEHDYTQYWVGFLFLITAFFAISAGSRQKNRWLVVTALFLFLACILVSLFALVVEGNDWINHKNNIRRKGFWESEDYDCDSIASTCICTKTNADSKVISDYLDCKTLERADYLYGALVCCILVGIFLVLSSIIVVIIFIPIRPFTVPVPKKRIKKITVLEDKPPPKPVVVKRRPPPKRIVETKPEVEEIVVRQRPPQRIIVEPKPEPVTEVEEVVVREHRPRVRTIVYDQPRQQPEIVYRIPRKRRTIVYDTPRPEAPSRSVALVPIEPAPRPPPQEKAYDVGRFVERVHPTPGESSKPGTENGFVVNPNYKKDETLPEPVEPEPVHYGVREVDPPVRYVEEQPAPVRYIRREEPPQVRYVRRPAPTVVYKRRPRPVEYRPRPEGQIVVKSKNLKPAYVIRKPVHRSVIAVRRRRAYSDEGPSLYRPRPREVVTKRRVYTNRPQPTRTVYTRQVPEVIHRRPRANSDEGPRLYHEGPRKIYTDQEIAAAGGNVPGPATEGVKPRVFTEENIGAANLGHQPTTAHINQGRSEGYDRLLEENLPSADQMSRRPPTPY